MTKKTVKKVIGKTTKAIATPPKIVSVKINRVALNSVQYSLDNTGKQVQLSASKEKAVLSAFKKFQEAQEILRKAYEE